MVDFTKVYFRFMKIQLNKSAIICLLANRQSTLVQLCFAELCLTAQSIQMFHYEISSDTPGSSTMA